MSPQRNVEREPQNTNGKPAGLLLLAMSFLPWMVFWGLAGTRFHSGVAIALGISCVLLAQQVWSRSYRIIDIATLILFALAAVATFLFKSALLLTAGTLLSFAALLTIALVSVAIRRPFTSEAARLDYPQPYWRNSSFIALHTIITLVWAALFLLCGVIVAFTNSTAAGPAPIALVIVGFAFTILFQMKGPALLVMQRYRPFEWHVPLAPSASRQQNEYDVAVIGAGIGGLTCAGLLAQRGYKVLVLEQQSQPGGYCRSLERGEFAFSAGVAGITGVWENGPVRRVLQQLGISPNGKFAAHERRYVYKGQSIDLGTDVQSVVAGLSESFPGESARVESFFQEASEAFFQLHEYSSRFGSPLPDHLVVRLMGDRAAAHLPRLYPALYDWMGKTLQQKLDDYFEDEALKTIVAAASGQNGTSPETTSGLRALIGCIGPQITGTYFPAGGPGALAEAMARAVESHGGTVMLNYRADRILTDHRQVRGVRSGADIFQAHVVVANVNARTCVLQLVDANEAGGLYIDFIKSLPMSRSAFIVYAGIEEDLSGYPSLIENIDGDFTILINSNMDPRLAPRGRSSITLIAPMGYRDFPPRDERDYDDRKRQFAALLLRKASEVLPGISDRVADLDAATPRTLESYTSMPEGALYGFDQSAGNRRPHFRAPIKGLYFAGASTFPGAGVESAMMSGVICANDISGWGKENERSR